MDHPHHIHTMNQMFYWEIRPKWPNMAIFQVILALPWDLRLFYYMGGFFFSETDTYEYILTLWIHVRLKQEKNLVKLT